MYFIVFRIAYNKLKCILDTDFFADLKVWTDSHLLQIQIIYAIQLFIKQLITKLNFPPRSDVTDPLVRPSASPNDITADFTIGPFRNICFSMIAYLLDRMMCSWCMEVSLSAFLDIMTDLPTDQRPDKAGHRKVTLMHYSLKFSVVLFYSYYQSGATKRCDLLKKKRF